MISGCEIEMILKPRKELFGDGNSYDAISSDAWMNAQRRKLERQQRRAELVQKTMNAMKDWFRNFKPKIAASA